MRIEQPADGKQVLLHVAFTNSSKQTIRFLHWHTPFEGWWNSFLTVTRDGAELRYRGPMAKRGPPERDAYVSIAAGATKTTAVDLAQVYDVLQPGIYQVAWSGKLFDLPPRNASLPRGLAQFTPATVACNTVNFSIPAP